MAGFSLRGRGDQHSIGADSLFLYARGAAAATADMASGGGIGFQLWHPHQQASSHTTSQFLSSSGVVLGFSSHDASVGIGGAGGGSGSGRAGTSCQDCGNNAKKDCAHLRCRTCCRSRGFACSTHVKSTWVPAAKRRERQRQLAALFRGAAAAANNNSAGATAANKRPRELVRSLGRLPTTTTTTTSSGSPNSRPQHQHVPTWLPLFTYITSTVAPNRLRDFFAYVSPMHVHDFYFRGEGAAARFLAEMSVEAVFRCVRIGAVDEPDAEFAYQTAVNIGGHTFKGILRDQGPNAAPLTPPSSADQYQLVRGRETPSPAGSSDAVGGHSATATSAAVLMDPYPTPIGAFATDTQFFPHNPRT